MVGLSSPQFLDHLESNSGVYLYCSQITARFLQASIRHRPLSPYVFPLQLEESVKITVPNVAEEVTHQLWVTLIPAAHCPGSVMFLFEGRGGTVLYTGDFRISVGEVSGIRPLHNSDGTVKQIDSLLIDTTFCHGDIMHFPSREESAQVVAEAVEEWLAKGNNFLIHLKCPAKYGYEFIYRNLHERFNMKIHVSRWIYCMYDTVPDIQDALTLDATMTWIHACHYRTKIGEENSDTSPVKQLPCRCVPYGVNTTPYIRVIKPSALFYTMYQSAKEIKQTSSDGTFCRVLLSMHASCSEVLDMVSYLRPRKVFPNVIPVDSTKEEVLKLLHEALNRSGDHYSIEYGGSQRRSLGSFKRQLNSNDSNSTGNTSSNFLDVGLVDVYLSSPNKRRRHSDSNMTLILPTPRGNMKGSLSLEGEGRHEDKAEQSDVASSSFHIPHPSDPSPSMPSCTQNNGEELEWKDPYSPSPKKNQSFIDAYSLESGSPSCTKRKLSIDEIPSNTDKNSLKDTRKHSNKTSVSDMEFEEATSSKSILKTDESLDSFEFNNSVFSEEGDRDSIFDPLDGSRPPSSVGLGESPIKQSRKMWYKHKYFSTPVHDEVEKGIKLEAKPCIGPRSSSLPLPEAYQDGLLSPDFFTSADSERNLPLITVSSPSDQASESQISDETNVTVILSSGEPSDSDLVLSDDLPADASGASDNILHANSFSSVRPSVICAPPKTDIEDTDAEDRRDSGIDTKEKEENWRETDSGWIDCNKVGKIKKTALEEFTARLEGSSTQSVCKVSLSDSNVCSERNKSSDSSPEVVDLVSSVNCSPDFNCGSSTELGKDASKTVPSSSRSSCLKRARRTHDHVEVVSLDHHPL